MTAELPTGSWTVHTVDGAEVRLRSGRIGLMSIDVSAPVTGGELVSTDEGVRFTLRMDLGRLKTGNFLLQAAARSLVSRHDAGVLTYDGRGTAGDGGWQVTGHATAGDVDLVLDLTITAIGAAADAMSEIELVGSADVGTVHLPLPGLGTVDDFSFDVDARLAMRPHRA
jgi:hypothetical protein